MARDRRRHQAQESRVNIPTGELRDFVADDERTQKSMLYPRDPSLDPQLVWKDLLNEEDLDSVESVKVVQLGSDAERAEYIGKRGWIR